MAAADTYANNIGRIYSDLGQSQAQAKLQSGAGWANAFGQIGQIAQNLPGQLADAKRQKQQDELFAVNMQDFLQKRQENQWLKNAIESSYDDSTGDVNERRLKENLRLVGVPELAERVLGPMRQAKMEKVQLDTALTQGKITADEYQQRVMGSLAPYAIEIAKENGAPAAIEGALAAIRLTHTPELSDALAKSIADNPAGVLPFVQSLIKPTEAEKPQVVAEGAALVGPDGKVVYQNPKTPTEKTPTFKEGVVDGKLRILKWDGETGTFVPTNASPQPTATGGGGVVGGSANDDVEAIADAIARGEQPPVLTGLYRMAGPVRAALAKRGYNLTDATSDWTATQKFIASANGVKQTTMRQAVETAYHSLDLIDGLASQWKGGRFPLLNKANLAAAVGGAYGPQAQTIATQLKAQITDLTSELGQVYMGGNSPTDHALELAGKNLSADWSESVLKDMTGLARKNLTIRQNSLNNARPAGTGENPYAAPVTAPTTQQAPANLIYDPVTKTFKKGGG